ncbi:hypothetical protein TNCV_2331391 [Trichonephila clavipes]|nr:hypothetical protein TNCV_2331391 [Trichonephila clavipes]
MVRVTWTTPELAPPLLTTTPHLREDVSALDRFNVHRCPNTATAGLFSGTGLELMTCFHDPLPLPLGYYSPARYQRTDINKSFLFLRMYFDSKKSKKSLL